MNKEEIEEIEMLEIDFNVTDELEQALEVSSKKAIYLIDNLIKELFKLQQRIDKAIEYIEKETKREGFNHHYINDEDLEELLEILKGVDYEKIKT